MEQELYYLIAKFLSAGPCKASAQALEHELDQQRQLLPHTLTYDGSQVPLTMDRLNKKYPDAKGQYLLSLMEHLLQHYKKTVDPQTLRANALRHGDESLLTMLSAFVPGKQYEKSNYLTMTQQELANLSVHRMLIAREMGANIMQKSCTQTFLSTFYKERVTINGHRFPVFCLAFDKTNRRLFTGSDDYLVKVWCVRTGYLIYTIRGHYNVITDIAINEENTLIATASSDGYVRVWTMDGYKQVASLRPISANAKPFTTVRFSPSPRSETRYLMATNEDGYVRLWKWNRDTFQFMNPESPITYSCKFRARDKLRCSSFNYTGTKFTVAGDDGFVYVFSTIKNNPIDTGRSSTRTSNQDGQSRRRRRVASALFPDKSGQDQPQPIEPIAILEGHMGSVTDLAFSHDGQRILSGSQDGTARIWSYNNENATWTSIILDIKKTPDVPMVKPSTASETAQKASKRLEDSSIGQQETSEFGTLIPPLSPSPSESILNNSITNQIMPVSVDTLTNHIDSYQPNSTPDLVTTNINITANAEHQDTEESPKVSMITWTADDRLCIVATTHGDIKVYYAYNGEPACILKGHKGETYAVDSHPQDPNTILSAGYDGNVILWDIRRQNVITWRNHPGRVFLDCKFSKDGMKYAITDDEGNCTLFGINGLDKDYAQTKNWTRGQYFYNDYLPVRYQEDGTFVDEQTNLSTHLLPPSPIIDLQGIEYPHQPRRGYGRDITIQAQTFETENSQRLVCYDKEERDIRTEIPPSLPVMDRAQIAKRRRDFVKNEDDDENETGGAGSALPPFQFPIPATQAYLLPDDSDDEDYREEATGGQIYGSSEEDSEEENEDVGSDEFEHVPTSTVEPWDEDETDDGPPVTRSRAGRQRHFSSSELSDNDLLPSTDARQSTRSSARILQPSSSSSTSNIVDRTSEDRATRATTRKRRREIQVQSDEEEDAPLRPRRRVRMRPKSYMESDLDDDFEELEDDMVNITDSGDEAQPSSVEAGPSTSNISTRSRRGTKARSTVMDSESDDSNSDNDDDDDDDFVKLPKRKIGKRRLQARIAESDDDVVMPMMTRAHSSTMSTSSTGGKKRATTSKTSHRPTHQRGINILRDLTEEEIKLYEPSPWISMTQRSVEKYLPQMGDRVALLLEGYQQYWEQSEMVECFDERHGPLQIKQNEPVIFAIIDGISWHVGPPCFCRLKLTIQELTNIRAVATEQADPHWVSPSSSSSSRNATGRHGITGMEEIIVEYSDEDGCPEFLVLWERFLASMSIFFGPVQPGQRVDAMYDVGKYTGQISTINDTGMYWQRAKSQSPWACYHIIWDDDSSPPEDLSPWEIVPIGEDFSEWYDVGSRLTDQQIHRARSVLDWICNTDDFLLYVHQVDYYTYSNYLSKIAYPICLEMVKDRLNNGFYRHLEAIIDDVELIRKNAQNYNHPTSLAYKNAARMANFFRTRMRNPRMPLSLGRTRKTQEEDDEYSDANMQEEDSEDSGLESKEAVLMDEVSEESDAFINDDDDEDDD
ncbi:uncharacterized protein BX664DRAFT_312183 [Halteromyces radiatus]|uniref:uncharacterized protein n=1 Tax=Halteromyces radiatus TaxID=101107 RepID=UPI0022204C43|nr:uncharacterized protein BX664DRAFT_312183 [Halteromyces radiatus]KAI8097330.1 hypothetical protein BX664DRAFT_312183 [Halteromyces radiatus]